MRPSSTSRKARALTSMPTCGSARTPSSTPACFVSDNRVESNGGSRFWVPDVNGTGGTTSATTRRPQPLSGRSSTSFRRKRPVAGTRTTISMIRSRTTSRLACTAPSATPTWEYDAYYARSQFEAEGPPELAADRGDRGFLPRPVPRPAVGHLLRLPGLSPESRRRSTSRVTPDQYDSFLGHDQDRLEDLDAQPQLAGHEHEPVRSARRPGRRARRWPRPASSPGTTRRIRASSPAISGASPARKAQASARIGRRRSSSACRSSAC